MQSNGLYREVKLKGKREREKDCNHGSSTIRRNNIQNMDEEYRLLPASSHQENADQEDGAGTDLLPTVASPLPLFVFFFFVNSFFFYPSLLQICLPSFPEEYTPATHS
jgi:hypothetical protein